MLAREAMRSEGINSGVDRLERIIKQIEGNGQPGVLKIVHQLEERCRALAVEHDELVEEMRREFVAIKNDWRHELALVREAVGKHGDFISNSGWRVAGGAVGILTAIVLGAIGILK